MSTNPHRRGAAGRPQSGMDAILAKTTNIEAQQRAEAERQEQRRYRGLTADAPPINQTFGGVVSLEKTDLMFASLALQTVLLMLILLELR